MPSYNIHIIQKGETIQSISDLYGIAIEDLMYFHNNNCKVEDSILINITNQKELILPRSAISDKKKLVQFSAGNLFELNPYNSFYNYEVSIIIEKENNANEIKYYASVRWISSENNLHYFEIDRISDMYVNGEEINEIADTLAYKTSSVLYPLRISVDKTGRFNSVENYKVFRQRWNGIKEEVYKDFEGEIVEEYLQKMEEVIEVPEVITLLVRNDFFIRTLFFGVCQKYGRDFLITGNESFPVIKNAVEPNYKIKLEIDPVVDDYNLVNIKGNGILHDERSKEDFMNETPFKLIVEESQVFNNAGDLRFRCYMNPETGLSESVYLECSIILDDIRKVSVTINSL